MFSIDSQEIENRNIQILTLAGEFDIAEKERVRGIFNNVLALEPEGLIIDLSSIALVDSSAIGLLVAYKSKLEAIGARLVVVIDSNNYLIRKLGHLGIFDGPGIELFDSLEQAKAAFEVDQIIF